MSRPCILEATPNGEDGKWAYDEIVMLKEQLAATQAYNELLRDFLLKAMEWNWLDDDIYEHVDVRQFQEVATSPINLSALNGVLAEAIMTFVGDFGRHVHGDGEFWLHELQDFAATHCAAMLANKEASDGTGQTL